MLLVARRAAEGGSQPRQLEPHVEVLRPELHPARLPLRLRLRASFDTRPFPRQARVVLEALKRYGMMLADNGSALYVSGVPDRRWSNDQLHTLARVHGSDFEVVDTRSLRNPTRAARP